ncbi:nucleotide-binding universal stress UspA family protein [Lewinella aquimaris]|uniref:Nucleotide-binding universal stress UspA family protein n=1 Tax=Neolewinella aquimaris TaxID=1835722 RepID=A0A840E2W2_9BACT|nr:universal stress protein [Neolewinella aquimaris]MBB4078005.1 nucleotide-binding universal stress UspA family protein [Neolewinella aquimaris]
MKTIESILVPTDFSEVALSAYCYALRLADALDASVELMYSIPPTTSTPGYGTFINTLTSVINEEARNNLNAFLQRGIGRVNDKLHHVPRVSTFIKVGDLRFSIRRHVEQENNQLIVMGTKGRHDAWDDFLGTNASYLAGRAPCPVLIIPPNTEYRNIESICFATDLNDVGTFQAGEVLRALRPFEPKLEFLHVHTNDKDVTDFNINLLREVFDRPETGMRASFTNRKAEDVTGAIFAFAFEQNCDLVVMHRPDRPWFVRLLRKSNTREAVQRARLPLLIITARDLAASDLPTERNTTEQQSA